MKREDQHLADPTVELIPSYAFENRPIEHDAARSAEHWTRTCQQQGGFDPLTRELLPLKYVSGQLSMYQALDHITAAVQAGVVNKNDWAAQLFADDDELEGFLLELESYDECYRITDRWWTALAHLADSSDDEEGFITCEEIADALRASIAAGHARRHELRLEADYFAKHPTKPLKLNRKQQQALQDHNAAVPKRTRTFPLVSSDASVMFRFINRYMFLNGHRLAAREATAEDIAKLMAKSAKPLKRTAPKSRPKTSASR